MGASVHQSLSTLSWTAAVAPGQRRAWTIQWRAAVPRLLSFPDGPVVTGRRCGGVRHRERNPAAEWGARLQDHKLCGGSGVEVVSHLVYKSEEEVLVQPGTVFRIEAIDRSSRDVRWTDRCRSCFLPSFASLDARSLIRRSFLPRPNDERSTRTSWRASGERITRGPATCG